MNQNARGVWTSASNASADRLCRGRYQAQQNLPELPGTDQSQSGIVIHALWTGTACPRRPTAEERDKAEVLLEEEANLSREFFHCRNGLIRIVERRLWHEFPLSTDAPERGTLKTSGQFDVALVHPKSRRALVCDGKSGWLENSPNASNLQLRRLAVLLWLHLEPREIGVGILRPLGKPERPCLYTVSDLKQSLAELEQDVRQSHGTHPSRTAGEEQCRYCRAREGCSTRLAWLSAGLPENLPGLPLTSAQDWTPEQRTAFLDREKDARQWLAARKEEIKVLLAEKPDAVPGYRLRPGRRVETITNPQKILKRFCDNLGGTFERFIKCVKIGKTALQDEVRSLSRHGGKALQADMDKLLAGCVEDKTSAPTIERIR